MLNKIGFRGKNPITLNQIFKNHDLVYLKSVNLVCSLIELLQKQ